MGISNTQQHIDMWSYGQHLEDDGRDHLGYKLDGALGHNRRIHDYAMDYDAWCASIRPRWWQFFKRPVYSYANYQRYLIEATKAHEAKTKMEAQAAADRRRILKEILDSEPPLTMATQTGLAPVPAPTIVPKRKDPKRAKPVDKAQPSPTSSNGESTRG